MTKKKPQDQPFILKSHHIKLLYMIHLFHIVTAEQACVLYYGNSIKYVQREIKVLVDHGYIQEGWITGRTRSPYYYMLTSKGARYCQKHGKDIVASFRHSKEQISDPSFITHHLEVNDVVISAMLLQRSAPTYCLDEFVHERELRRNPYQGIWQGKDFSLVPDALLTFSTTLPGGKRGQMHLNLELDCGTEEQQHFRWKIRRYIALKDLPGTIAFITFVGPKRLAQMRKWTQLELAATNESKAIGLRFCFASLTRPLDQQIWLSPCFYTPYLEDKPIILLGGE